MTKKSYVGFYWPVWPDFRPNCAIFRIYYTGAKMTRSYFSIFFQYSWYISVRNQTKNICWPFSAMIANQMAPFRILPQFRRQNRPWHFWLAPYTPLWFSSKLALQQTVITIKVFQINLKFHNYSLIKTFKLLFGVVNVLV